MNQTIAILSLPTECEQAIRQVVGRLTGIGLQVMRSFDLQVARAAHVDCTCPHHGTQRCDCQMVVLLVYDRSHQPVTLVAHGHDGRTHFAMVDTPQQPLDRQLGATIREALSPVDLARPGEGTRAS